ncbi:nucleoside:proton symporter [Aquisalinus flavus]|nr:nucleoside:proton symporter [Aquisalinus flavus]UNE46991.1 nucleoside:proton symporter [Aquisalinus flavus]
MSMEFGLRGQSMLGIFAFMAIAWLLSERKLKFPFMSAIWAVAIQIGVAAFFLQFDPARRALRGLNGLVDALQSATLEGTSFLFGYLGTSDPAAMPFDPVEGAPLFIFAFQGLFLVVFISALSAVLWHWGILKWIVRGFAMILTRVFGTGGAVSLAAAANVFLGQTEAPLLIRAYLDRVTRSELFTIITSGYATVAGSVIVLYATILAPIEPSILGHIIVASIISVPAALLIGRIMVPYSDEETPTPTSAGDDFQYEGSMDAFMHGVTEGGKLWWNIVISILAFIALAALINIMLDAFIPDVGGAPLTLERMLGWVFMPLVWLAGVPFEEAFQAGQLMGIKTALNEVIAYIELASLEPGTLSERTSLIMVYALCGFANIGSLGIVIGGLSSLVPNRRKEIIQLAPKALVGGTLATLMSGAVIGVIWMG